MKVLAAYWDELVSGFITALFVAILTVTWANLVFDFLPESYLSLGIFLSLIGTVIMSIATIYGSDIVYMIASPQDATAVICSAVAISIAAKGELVTDQERALTVIAMVALTSFVVGISCFMTGKFRLGKSAEYIPFPVIAGFIAGTGGIIFFAGIKTCTGIPFSLGNIPKLFEKSLFLRWFLPLCYTAIWVVVIEKIGKRQLLLLSILGALPLFFLYMFIADISLEEMGREGLLLGPFEKFRVEELPELFQIGAVRWEILLDYTLEYLTAAVLVIISLVFNNSSVEASTSDEIDIDKELVVTGVSNLLAASVASIGGYIQLTPTLINQQFGAKRKLSAWLRTLLLMIIALFGVSAVGLIPKSLFAIMLFYIALTRLYSWLYLTRTQISALEYSVVPMIAVVMLFYGLVVGVAIGLLASVIIFAIRYSRINIIKMEFDGDLLSSNVLRDQVSKSVIKEESSKIRVILLQSYIFFGNAVGLLDRIRHELQVAKNRIEYLIIDFEKVLGADTSTIYSFVKISRTCSNYGVKLILSNLPLSIQKKIETAKRAGSLIDYTPCSDLDYSLEFCEEDILKKHHKERWGDVKLIFKNLLPSVSKHVAFFESLTRVEVQKGELVMREGEPSDCLFFLERGKVYIFTTDENGEEHRLKVLHEGTVIGEAGFLLGVNRTASVRALEDSLLAHVTGERLEKLKKSHPAVVADLFFDMLKIATIRFTETARLARLFRE